MNMLKLDKQIAILSALVEGNSIRSTEHMTQTHRDTILRLVRRVGEGCQRLLDHQFRSIHSQHLQVDEIWTFVGKKQAQLTDEERDNPGLGDQYVFVDWMQKRSSSRHFLWGSVMERSPCSL